MNPAEIFHFVFCDKDFILDSRNTISLPLCLPSLSFPEKCIYLFSSANVDLN